MAAFNSLGHVAFRVNDLDRSLEFYRKLGFPEFLRLTQEDGRPWIAYVRVTDELYLELFPGGDGGKATGPEHTGVHHLCLTTDDIEKTAAHLEAVGIPATAALVPTRRGVDGNPATSEAVQPSVSYDGKRITFVSRAANLASGVSSAARYIWVYDDSGSAGTSNKLDVVRGAGGVLPNNDSEAPAISCNGRIVAFDTRADMPRIFTGSAAAGIDRRLTKLGSDALAEPESFLVDKSSRLLAGEEERARSWASALAPHIADEVSVARR